MNNWAAKHALVVGGSAGLGRELAADLCQRGTTVGIVARDAARLNETAARLGCAARWTCDITSGEQVTALFKEIERTWGKLDLLINAAGKSARGLAAKTTPEQFRELWELNFLGTVRCIQAALPLMPADGTVVNIGSLAAKIASPHMGAYPSSKFPLAAYSQQLRLELPKLHVLLVCPGPIRRDDAGQRYAESGDVPESALQPAAGVKLRGIAPERLAGMILKACQRRQPELIVPARARLLFAIADLFPKLGDWLVRKMTS